MKKTKKKEIIKKRGLGSASLTTRKRVASLGGKASHAGLKNASLATRKRVAIMGGKASHGGGRPKSKKKK